MNVNQENVSQLRSQIAALRSNVRENTVSAAVYGGLAAANLFLANYPENEITLVNAGATAILGGFAIKNVFDVCSDNREIASREAAIERVAEQTPVE